MFDVYEICIYKIKCPSGSLCRDEKSSIGS